MGSEAVPINKQPGLTPSLVNQRCYIVSGCLAGACTLPIEIFYQRPASLTHFLRTLGPVPVYRAGFRFWTFTHVKHQLTTSSVSFPAWAVGALGGAAGGLVEVSAQAALQRRMPQSIALATQSLRLFFCFGTYGFLSTNLSEELPPKPFWYCWTLGVIAGGVGSGIAAAALEGVRGKALWTSSIPRGAITIGTIISVHVTSCDALLKRIEEE